MTDIMSDQKIFIFDISQHFIHLLHVATFYLFIYLSILKSCS